jgi:hypothetical protein
MTAQYAFDTLAFVKRLSAAGMETPHAEALVDSAFNNLATKADLRELQLATKTDLRELQSATEAKLRELDQSLTNKLTVRMGAMTAATIAIISALKIFS